jgi:hypothetical protein
LKRGVSSSLPNGISDLELADWNTKENYGVAIYGLAMEVYVQPYVIDGLLCMFFETCTIYQETDQRRLIVETVMIKDNTFILVALLISVL